REVGKRSIAELLTGESEVSSGAVGFNARIIRSESGKGRAIPDGVQSGTAGAYFEIAGCGIGKVVELARVDLVEVHALPVSAKFIRSKCEPDTSESPVAVADDTAGVIEGAELRNVLRCIECTAS